MAANNMYRVGDYVYFEVSASSPYQIRRIEELNKASSGDVEAKVACFFRRRDLTNTLLQQAQRYYSIDELDSEEESGTAQDVSDEKKNDENLDFQSSPKIFQSESTENGLKKSTLSHIQKHHLKHRELFLSRQVEVLPAKHIRGKCSVTLFNNVEPLSNYLAREDAFYYKLIYDPIQKTLQEDRGTLRIGLEYQCQIQPLLQDASKDPRLTQKWEKIAWESISFNTLSEQDFETFLTLCRSIGTYGRAFDPATLLNSKSGSPHSLYLVNAVASSNRDITLQLAHDLLHEAKYDIKKAMHLLTPNGQPLICKDQLDEWSPSEVQLFEEALEKYSKVFSDIYSDFLPWKTHQAIVEMYYFWKTTDRYVKRRRNKLLAQEHKLKQVYIPNYNKPNQSVLFQTAAPSHVVAKKTNSGCDSCTNQQSTQWYAWGPSSMVCKLCNNCWSYWKKFGGLKTPEASNKAVLPSEREMRAQERLEAAAAASQKPDSSIASTVANGNLNINVHAANARGAAKANESPFGGLLPLVFEKASTMTGPAGTICQVTPAFVRISRLASTELFKSKLLARKLGVSAYETTSKALFGNVESFETLFKQMKDITKSIISEENSKRETILDKLKQKLRKCGKMQIIECVAKIASLKNIDLVADETNEVLRSLKRHAEESDFNGPSAKKPVLQNEEEIS